MTYLSRLILNPRSRQVQAELARPYEMHRTLLKAFPDGRVNTPRSEDEAVAMLFRVDVNARTGDLCLLVQSQQKADWSLLPDSGYLLPGAADNPASKELKLPVRDGLSLSFRLLANPTKRLSTRKDQDAEKTEGKRIGLYTEEEQRLWLERKGKQHGFSVLTVTPSRQQRLDDHKHDLKLFSVQFDGILRVTDSERFQMALQSGIGSGKAFGFGLLSVAPVA